MSAAPAALETDRWDLSGIYASLDDPRIEAHLASARRDAEAFAASFRDRIASLEPPEFRAMLERLEDISLRAHRPSWYAGLRFAAQTDDAAVKRLLDRVRTAATETQNLLAFARLELAILPDEAAERLLAAPELADYRHAIEARRRFGPHTLSEPEEQLLSSKALTGRSAWTQLYTEVTSAIRVPLTVDGEERVLTVAEARALASHPDRDLRRRAREAVYAAQAERENVLTFVFNTLYQDWKLDAELRRYEGLIEPTLLRDEVPPATVAALMDTTEANYGLAQDYYRLKAWVLGLADFARSDVLAPYEPSERRYSFEEARDLVLAALGAFSPQFEEVARGFFEERRIDVGPRPGKRGGAFCSSFSPSEHAYILTNFTGRLEDVFTLAHELGHGLHAELSRGQNPSNFGHSLPLAETASVFCEMLLTDHLLRHGDAATRRDLLASQLEDAVGTVMRQVQITRWEARAHAERAGGVVTAERFCELWMEEYAKLYGDAVAPVEGERWEWIGIPHVVSSRFYCYSYAFGMLLVFALYGRYKAEGESFVPRYLEFLSSGESQGPEALVSGLGVDLADASFWQSGFDHLRGLLEELRAAFTKGSISGPAL